MRKNFWGFNAVFLGLWEGIALSSRRLPTISRVVWRLETHHPSRTRIGVIVWLALLGKHLLTPEEDE